MLAYCSLLHYNHCYHATGFTTCAIYNMPNFVRISSAAFVHAIADTLPLPHRTCSLYTNPHSTSPPGYIKMDEMDAFRAANPEKAQTLMELIERGMKNGKYCTILPSRLLSLLTLSTIDKAAMEGYRADEIAGFPNRHANTDEANGTEIVVFNVSAGNLITGCHVCGQEANISRCGGCKVVFYCGQEHQTSDRPAHKGSCSKIKKARTRLEAQEIALRAHAGDMDTPPNAFAEGGEGLGHFWGYKGTRPYMQARYYLIDALLRINTAQAIEAALEHGMDMLRLNRSDNQSIRSIVPWLFLRLRRDQECYDFLKRWSTISQGEDDEFDWVTTTKNQDAFEPVIDFLKGFNPLSHLVSLALLKVRMLIDMRGFSARPRSQHFVSSIVAKDRTTFESGGSEVICDWLRKLVMNLYVAVVCANQHFWPALLSPGDNLTIRPDGFMMGSQEEMQITLQWCYNAWIETPGAFAILEEMARDAGVREALARFSES
jgi:hypothetical protein